MSIPRYQKIRDKSNWVRKGLAFAGMFCVASGTGASVTDENFIELNTWSYNDSIEIHGLESSAAIGHESSAQRLAFIRDNSGLSLTSIAIIFGVSRPTVYGWIKGSEPKANLLSKIGMLSNSIKRLVHIDAKSLAKLIMRPIFNGESFGDKIKKGVEVDSYIQDILDIAEKERINRSLKKGGLNLSRSVIDAASHHSTPITRDS